MFDTTTYQLGGVPQAENVTCSLADAIAAYVAAAYNTTYDVLDENSPEVEQFVSMLSEGYATEISGNTDDFENGSDIPASLVESVFQLQAEGGEWKSPSFYSIFWASLCQEQ